MVPLPKLLPTKSFDPNESIRGGLMDWCKKLKTKILATVGTLPPPAVAFGTLKSPRGQMVQQQQQQRQLKQTQQQEKSKSKKNECSCSSEEEEMKESTK